jgi:cytosine/adenosine deaminase-related metal-dependent hydrolase
LYRKLTADRIFNGHQFLPANSVLIVDQNNRIIDIVKSADAGEDIKFYEGILSPGFVNCHCHVELSHLKGMISKETGLIDFLLSVMGKREAEAEMISHAIEMAESEMIANGIVAVGDICNTNLSIPQKRKDKLYYHNFIEVSGFPLEVADKRFEQSNLLFEEFSTLHSNNSIVPHAPYSVSHVLLQKITDFEKNTIISMHNQEAQDENDFYRSKQGGFLELYKKLNITIDFFDPHNKSSLLTLLPHFNEAQKLLLVHNLHTTESDILSAKEKYKTQLDNLFFCLCPNANKYISGDLPDVNLFVQQQCNLVIGTDSLASNEHLSIMDEINTILETNSTISMEDALKWATLNGAKFLGIDQQYGSFDIGKKPGINLINEQRIEKLF